MNTVEILIFLAVAGCGWLWYENTQARETALAAVREACRAEGLQFLDETVVLARLRPTRTAEGWIAWWRVYEFEYSDTGDNRRRGGVHLLGGRVTLLNVGPRLVASR
ncbi:DUF3301 domain-containing protein [Methylomagnum ishizawai]|uniref:DUF3301 domain-containing protein n=1 Tax=Methylomagnum ishizawai TaxID=1760988 RepID=UPI001C80DE03|nr:DUF3301 domain-containing protein [Methylomagnum ishizawai]